MLRKQYCEKFGCPAKERSYSITQASEKNLERLKFERSEYFRERIKIRHRIEEKNGELKEAHGLRRAGYAVKEPSLCMLKSKFVYKSCLYHRSKKLSLKKWEFFSALICQPNNSIDFTPWIVIYVHM